MSLATIQKVINISPITNADNIDVAKVLGWEVVVRKGEFQPGDLCIYIEIDSLIPNKEWSKFLFKTGHGEDEYFRLRTIKLRGQISQGLVLPLEEVLGYSFVYKPGLGYFWDNGQPIEIGDDVTDNLGIKKYEHPVPLGYNSKSGKIITRKFPEFIPKTDEVRIQSAPELLEQLKGKPYYITMKMDGTSFTCYRYKDKFGVCSRNIEMKDPRNNKGERIKYIIDKVKRFLGLAKQKDMRNPRTHDLGVYWNIALKYNLDKILPEGYAIQGEICGPSIQGNKIGLEEIELFIFNIWNIKNQYRINPFDVFNEWEDRCDFFGEDNYKYSVDLKPVPFVGGTTYFDFDLNGLLNIANCLNYPNGSPAEGIVVRSLDQSISFKVVSNRFLLKYGE